MSYVREGREVGISSPIDDEVLVRSCSCFMQAAADTDSMFKTSLTCTENAVCLQHLLSLPLTMHFLTLSIL